MTKTLEIDDALVEAARETTGEKDARAAVERLLADALDVRRKALTLLDLVGKVEFCEDYDPKTVWGHRNDPG